MQSAADRDLHQPVPGWMELDFVDPATVPVVRAQDGRIRIRLVSPLDRFLGSGQAPQLIDPFGSPVRTVPLQPLHQRGVRRE